MPNINPRKKKLDAISRKIAIFYAQETYTTGEEDGRKKLEEAIQCLDEAVRIFVAADEKAERK